MPKTRRTHLMGKAKASPHQAESAPGQKIEALERMVSDLEKALRQQKTQAESSAQALEAFAYSVSHDLKAPLRAVTGFSEALLHDSAPSIDVKGREYVERIVHSAQRMGEMLDHLLRFSRAARSEPSWQKVDLSKLATEISMSLQSQAPKRAITWVVEPSLSHQGDEKWLRMVLEILLHNAWKFTELTSSPRIEFGVQRQECPVYFVRDNGTGFSPLYADKLFYPFQRLHPADQFPGQGMGLAIARRIIVRLGGRIWAESEPGKGATFFFTLAG